MFVCFHVKFLCVRSSHARVDILSPIADEFGEELAVPLEEIGVLPLNNTFLPFISKMIISTLSHLLLTYIVFQVKKFVLYFYS